MRRIIVGLAILTLTACQPGRDAENPPPPGAAPAASAGAAADEAARPGPPEADDEVGNILFIGTSITAGYGVGEELAYPARIQQLIDSAELPFRVVNAGISGETSAGGLRRIDWSLQRPIDVLVVELGANDGLRGLPVDAMRTNLDALLARTRGAYPDVAVVILGMEAPPNLGNAYTDAFRRVFTDLAARHGAALVPFVLDSVVAEPSLNIDDGIHPNAAGHTIIARNVWRTLGPVLRRRASATQGASGDSL